jgi:hypothetical protein
VLGGGQERKRLAAKLEALGILGMDSNGQSHVRVLLSGNLPR